MSPKTKLLPYLVLLIPMQTQAIDQYHSKNIPLAYTETYEGMFPHAKRYFTIDMLQCTQHHFSKQVFRDHTYLQFPLERNAKSKQSVNSISLASFETYTQGAFSNWLSGSDGYMYSGAFDKQKMTSFHTYYSANHGYLQGSVDQENYDHCYINVLTDFNQAEYSQGKEPVSPVPELPQSALFILGLGFMVFSQRKKLFVKN